MFKCHLLGVGTGDLVSGLKGHHNGVLKSPFQYSLSQCDDEAVRQNAEYERALSIRDIWRENAVYDCLGRHPFVVQHYNGRGYVSALSTCHEARFEIT
jgi:hypothetical protein